MLVCSALWCCLLPCAKVPAPGRRLDVVPDVVPHAAQPVLKTRHPLVVILKAMLRAIRCSHWRWLLIISPDSATYHTSPRKQVHDIKTGHITTTEQQKQKETTCTLQLVDVWWVSAPEFALIVLIISPKNEEHWKWCTERLSVFGGGHIGLQRFVHVQCHFQPLPTELVFAYFDRGSSDQPCQRDIPNWHVRDHFNAFMIVGINQSQSTWTWKCL